MVIINKGSSRVIRLTLPLRDAEIIMEIDASGGFVHTKMYLVASEKRFLGTKTLKSTRRNAKRIKELFEQYLDHTLQTNYDETGLFASSETLANATFVYKDLDPRVKFYCCDDGSKTCEILEFGINDEMIREWIDQLDYLLSMK